MSSNDFGLFLRTMVDLFDRAYGILMSFRIAGVPLGVILLGFLALSIFFKIVRHISVGGGEE